MKTWKIFSEILFFIFEVIEIIFKTFYVGNDILIKIKLVAFKFDYHLFKIIFAYFIKIKWNKKNDLRIKCFELSKKEKWRMLLLFRT